MCGGPHAERCSEGKQGREAGQTQRGSGAAQVRGGAGAGRLRCGAAGPEVTGQATERVTETMGTQKRVGVCMLESVLTPWC